MNSLDALHAKHPSDPGAREAPPTTAVASLRALRQSWRANGGFTFDWRKVRHLLQSVGPVLLPASGALAYGLGYLSVTKFGKVLRVSAHDLGFDAKDYIALTSVWLVLVGAALGLMLVGYLLCRPLAREWWANRAAHRHGLFYLSVLSVAGLTVGSHRALRLLLDETQAAGLSRVVGLVLMSVGLGALVALMAAMSRTGRSWKRFLFIAVIGGIPIPSLTSQLDAASEFGGDVVRAAKESRLVGSTGFMVALVVEPVHGLVRLPDGRERCVLRVAERVFVTVGDGETLGAPQGSFVTDARCSP